MFKPLLNGGLYGNWTHVTDLTGQCINHYTNKPMAALHGNAPCSFAGKANDLLLIYRAIRVFDKNNKDWFSSSYYKYVRCNLYLQFKNSIETSSSSAVLKFQLRLWHLNCRSIPYYPLRKIILKKISLKILANHYQATKPRRGAG